MSRPISLRFQGKALDLAIELRAPHASVTRGHEKMEAEVHRDGRWTEIRQGEETARCAVASAAGKIWVASNGRAYVFERVHREAVGQTGAVTEDEIRAPMTGRVVSVAAQPGTRVHEGDLLLTIEAMKMEFRLTAPENGVTAEVLCAVGDRVELGQLLVRLEPENGAAS